MTTLAELAQPIINNPPVGPPPISALRARRRRRTTRRVVASLGVAGLVLTGALSLNLGDSSTTNVTTGPAEPVPATTAGTPSHLLDGNAPVLTGVDLTGRPFNLADLRGKTVLVSFFATSDPQSELLVSHLVQFSHAHPPTSNVAVIGVVTSAPQPRSASNLIDLPFPVLGDPDDRDAAAWDVSSPPETFLVDPGGIVRLQLSGDVNVDTLDRLSNPPAIGTGPTADVAIASRPGTAGYANGIDLWAADQAGPGTLVPVRDRRGELVGYFGVGDLGFVDLSIAQNGAELSALRACDHELETLLNNVDAINAGETVNPACTAVLAADGIIVPTRFQPRRTDAPPATIVVPEVIGLSINNADQLLQKLGFYVPVNPNPDPYDPGVRNVVTAQHPDPGVHVRAPGAILLTFTP